MISSVTVPALAHDAMMLREFKHRVSDNGHLERKIVATLIAFLATRGFRIAGVHDYESLTRVRSAKAAMELVFNLDNCNLHFKDAKGEEECMCLVLGNGHDIVSDWFYSDGDPNGWNAAMNAFIEHVYEINV